MAVKREYIVDKIKVNKPLELGEPANITVTYDNGEWQQIMTSPIYNYSHNVTGRIQINTKNSVYIGELKNPEILDINQNQRQSSWIQDFDKAVNNLASYSEAMEY